MLLPRILVCGLILGVIVSVSGCTGAATPTAGTPDWPTTDWRTSTPEEQGLDSALILDMLQEIQAKQLPIHSILLIRHGYLVSEVYFPPYTSELKHPLFSASKSVTSMLVGKALQDGYIKSVKQTVLDFFPEIATDKTDPRRKELTVEHLLTMSAGYGTNTLPNFVGKDAEFDVAKHLLTYDSILHKPGSTFYYDSGSPHLLSAIIQKTAGLTLQEYAQQKIFEPLGITDTIWQADPQGTTTGHTGLMLRPRDMAKLGYLYLQRGQWNGEQLVPASWVEASATKHIETTGLMNAAEDDGYGYLWWMNGYDGYAAHGFGGQYIFVLPQADMVAVFTSGLPDPLFPTPRQLVKSYLLPAIQATQTLPPNPEAQHELEAEIQSIEHGTGTVGPLPSIAQQISGKPYQLTPTPDSTDLFRSIVLTFTGRDEYRSETIWPGKQQVIVTGSLTGTFHLNPIEFVSPEGPTPLTVAVRGYWQDEQTFVEEYVRDFPIDIARITQKYTFDGQRVAIEIRSSMNSNVIQIAGEMTD
jgi:CubicO group peptidase (beta-lactamase class C family)